MKHLIFSILIFIAIRVDAGMVRVVDVIDGHTLIIERNGSRETVQLAGIAITDEARAADLLRWNVLSTWVMLEPHPDGAYLAYRSPDALFVNRELVARGYARATTFGIEAPRNLVVTYLGTIDPPVTSSLSSTTTRPQPALRRAPKAASKTPKAGRRRAGR
jgi:endonuclease YncB( thermonuclease family)